VTAQLTANQRDYIRGRVDWRAGQPDRAMWLGSEAYRLGMAEERADQADHDVLAWAEEQLAVEETTVTTDTPTL
jgi:hypothetical protein